MSPQDVLGLVGVEEVFDSVRSELHDVSCAIGVSDEVRLNAQVLIAVGWVRPQDVYHKLLLSCGHLVNDLQWSLNSINLVKCVQCASNASMQADDSIINNSCKREPIKEIVDLVEDRVWVVWIFSESAAALLSESESIVDPLVLVVSSQEMDLVWELDLQGHQQADGLQRVSTSVNIVTQEQVVITLDISAVIWDSPQVEEPHQILVLSMDVSEHLDRGINSEHHWLVHEDPLALIGQGDDKLPSEGEEAISIVLSRPLSWLEQMGKEQVVDPITLLLSSSSSTVRPRLLVLGVLGECLELCKSLAWSGLILDLVHPDLVVLSGQTLHGWGPLSIMALSGTSCSCLILPPVDGSKALLKLAHERWHILEKGKQVKLHDGVRWDVWCLILKASMHVDVGIDRPDCVSESLK